MAEAYGSRTLREIIRVIAARFLGMVVIFAAVIGTTWALTVHAPRWYRSEVQLLVAPSRTLNPLENQASVRDDVTLFARTQRDIVKSDFVIVSALMRLQKMEAQPVPEKDDGEYQWYKDEDLQEFAQRNARRLAAAKKRIEVVTPGGTDAAFTQTFRIRVDWCEERQEAAKAGVPSREFAVNRTHELAQHVLEAYRLRHRQLEIERTRGSAELLRGRLLRTAQDDLTKTDKALQNFIDEKLQGNLRVIRLWTSGRPGGGEAGVASLAALFTSRLSDLEVDLSRFQALQQKVDEQLSKDDFEKIAIPDAVTAANPLVSALQSRILALKLRVHLLEEQYTSDYQDLKNLLAELTKAKNELLAELRRQRERLAQTIAELETQKAELNRIVTQRDEEVNQLASLSAEYERLERARNTAQDIFDTRKKEVLSAEMAKELAETPIFVSVLDPPSRPSPDRPRRPIFWLNLLIAAVGGFILAMVYAFLADHFDHSIKSIDDVERYLGVPVLASVPRIRGRIIRSR